MDLSKVSIDDPLPSTPTGDATLEEDDGVVLVQSAVVDKPVVLLTSSANTPTQEAQDLPSKGDDVTRPPGLLNLVFCFLVVNSI